MKKLVLPGLALLGVVALLLVATSVSAAINFRDPSFGKVWNRVDKPVEERSQLGRGYTWGPVVQGSEGISGEIYNTATRDVQYFDKARMEINSSANPNDLFYVTTGLLVKELVTGQRQDGDSTFTNLSPSTVQIAGDPNDNGANTVAPTYASFRSVVTFSGNENGKPAALGSAINSQIDVTGNVSQINPPEQRIIKGYDSNTQHNIADVFVNYGIQNGVIWSGSVFEQGSIFFNNPTYVLGRPVTEPYWIRAVVSGVEKNVLVQLFERRVLTYTPTNAPAFKVEMGNVGQHYYKWRYVTSVIAPLPTVTPVPTIVSIPEPTAMPLPGPTLVPVNGLLVNPNSGPIGQKFQVSGTGFGANESVSVWETGPDMQVTNLPGVTSDSNGKFIFTYQGHAPSGTYTLTVHGNSSGVEKLGDLVVGDASAVPVPSSGFLDVNPASGPVGQKFQISGTGFGVGEIITLWETGPDMRVSGLPGITSDANGRFTFTYQGHVPIGIYTLTAHGNSSGVEKLCDIAVGTNSATPVPASGFLEVNPASGRVGQKFQITGTGFGVGEIITLWETDPNMGVSGLPAITSDTNGRFTFTYQGHSPIGTYTVTGHGNSSGVEKLCDIVVLG